MVNMISYDIVSTGGGKKQTMTLVHGQVQNSGYFNSVIPHFADRFDLILIDMRGHGKSSHIPGPYGNFEYTEDIVEVLDKENVRNTCFWATHTGTGASLAIAVTRPELIGSLILEGAVLPDVKMDRTNELIARAKLIARSEGVQKAIDDWFENADWYSYMQAHPKQTNAEAQRQLLNEFTGATWLCGATPKPAHNVYSQLKSIIQPVMIYNGLYDLDEFHLIAGILEENIKTVVREIIPDAGGFPLWENAGKVIPLVKEFIDNSI